MLSSNLLHSASQSNSMCTRFCYQFKSHSTFQTMIRIYLPTCFASTIFFLLKTFSVSFNTSSTWYTSKLSNFAFQLGMCILSHRIKTTIAFAHIKQIINWARSIYAVSLPHRNCVLNHIPTPLSYKLLIHDEIHITWFRLSSRMHIVAIIHYSKSLFLFIFNPIHIIRNATLE